jgi:hypothetical protein
VTRTGSGSTTARVQASVAAARTGSGSTTARVAAASTRTKSGTVSATVQFWPWRMKIGGVSTPVVPKVAGQQVIAVYKKTGTSPDYRRAPILTYPRSFGAYGSYMPSTGTAGCPAEFVSQLTPWYGNKVVTSPSEVIDLLDIHGRLIFQCPTLNTPAQRFIVRGYGASDVATTTPIIDCTSAAITGQIVMQDFTVRPDEPSEWTVGVEGHHWTIIRPYLVDLQDGYRARNNASGISNTNVLWGLIDYLTYFRVAASRAASLQTHNDCAQLIGSNGHTVRGSLYFARYGPRGAFQPKIIENVAVTTGANNDHPETACIQINVASNGDKVQNLLINKSWMFGGYYPINFGDPGNDGTLAAPWLLGEVSESWGDSAEKHGSPPIWLNGRSQQRIDDKAGTALNNKWFDGSRMGQEIVATYG